MTRKGATLLAVALAAAAAGTAWWAFGSDPGSEGGAAYASDGRLLRRVRAPWQPPNLVVLVLDTLRADAVDPGPVGAEPPETPMPYLASLAARGALFRQASSSSAWTMPAVASLLTGLEPRRHGADDAREPPALPASVTTFAELLAHAYGYDTAALVDTSWIGGPQAIGQGFSRFEQLFCLEDSARRLDSWNAARDASRPFFLYVHTLEAHDPYGRANHVCPQQPVGPPTPVLLGPDSEPWELARTFFLDREARRSLFLQDGDAFGTIARYTTRGYAESPRPELAAEIRAAYLDGVRWTDAGVARLVAWLESKALLENTLLVVTSDHGEAFGEHGLLGHGRALHDELLRVPLVFVGPEPFRGGKVVESSVGLVDVLPTFLDLAGMAPLDGIDGRSLLPVVAGRSPGWPVLAQETRHFLNAREPGDVLLGSARSDSWKYVLSYDVAAGTVNEEIYDLLLDPGERTNLAWTPPGTLGLDPAFCRAVERVRDDLWAAIDEQRARDALGAAGPVGADVPRRPDPCQFR